MTNYNQKFSQRPMNVTGTLFNGPAVATGTAYTVETCNQVIAAYKTANQSAFSFKFQGSTNGTDWTDIGSAITTAAAVQNTMPWPYLRVDVTSVGTNTAKTASGITQTAGTATFSCNSHGFLANDYVTIAGADQAGYNGSFQVLTAGANSFTYAVVSTTVTPATGTITATGNFRVLVAE